MWSMPSISRVGSQEPSGAPVGLNLCSHAPMPPSPMYRLPAASTAQLSGLVSRRLPAAHVCTHRRASKAPWLLNLLTDDAYAPKLKFVVYRLPAASKHMPVCSSLSVVLSSDPSMVPLGLY